MTGARPCFRGRPETHLQWLQRRQRAHGDGCLEWPFRRRDGGLTGLCFAGHSALSPITVACTLANGQAPAEMPYVVQSCGNPRCVAAQHLGWAAERYSAILTVEQVYEIRAAGKGEILRLAIDFGISHATAYAIRARRKWRHIA